MTLSSIRQNEKIRIDWQGAKPRIVFGDKSLYDVMTKGPKPFNVMVVADTKPSMTMCREWRRTLRKINASVAGKKSVSTSPSIENRKT